MTDNTNDTSNVLMSADTDSLDYQVHAALAVLGTSGNEKPYYM